MKQILFILVASLGLSAQAGLRQSAVACFAGPTASTTLVCPFGSTTVAGDYVYIVASIMANGFCPGGSSFALPGVSGISDGSNTYTVQKSISQGTFDSMSSWTAPVTTGQTTVTLTFNTSQACFTASMYDVKGATSFETIPAAAKFAFPAQTTTVANDFLIAHATDEIEHITLTPTGSWTTSLSTNNSTANASVIGITFTDSSTGSITPPPLSAGFNTDWTFFFTIAFIPTPAPTNQARPQIF